MYSKNENKYYNMEFLHKLNEYMLLYLLNIQETVHKAKKDSFILIILSEKKHNLL